MSDPSTKAKPGLSWRRAAAGAVLTVAVILPSAIGFNIVIGRVIHWDIVAVLGGAGFLGLTLVLRYVR